MDADNGFMGDGSAWVFFLFFLLAWGNNGVFGNCGNGVTKADLTQGFDFNNLNRQVLDLSNKLGENTYVLKGAIDNCCLMFCRQPCW